MATIHANHHARKGLWLALVLAIGTALTYVLIAAGALGVGDPQVAAAGGAIIYIAAGSYLLGGLLILAHRRWLWIVAGLVFLMVVVGGATRLTGSGLSITEWKPITGAMPPLSAFPPGGITGLHEAVLAAIAERGWKCDIYLNLGILKTADQERLAAMTLRSRIEVFENSSVLFCNMA